MQSEPRPARRSVWALPLSLAATHRIDVSFSSSGYLDVSVRRVPSACLWIQHAVTEVFSAGFPHSDISGSMDICSSPKLFAAYHVFHRLLVPRHPPCALISLTTARVHSVGRFGFQLVSLFPYILLYGLGCLLFNNSFNMRFSRYVLYVRSTVHAFSPFRFTDQWRWRDSNS